MQWTVRRYTSYTYYFFMICKNCSGEYVGETGIPINERTNLHRSRIENEKNHKLDISQYIGNNKNLKFTIS